VVEVPALQMARSRELSLAAAAAEMVEVARAVAAARVAAMVAAARVASRAIEKAFAVATPRWRLRRVASLAIGHSCYGSGLSTLHVYRKIDIDIDIDI